MPPTFAIESTCLLDNLASGIARYTAQLIGNLQALVGEAPADFRVLQLYRASRWRRRTRLPGGAHLARQVWYKDLWPPRKPYALVHCPDHRLPHWSIPKVVTIHDVYAAFGVNFSDPAARAKQVAIYADFARRADRIIFDSRHTRDDFFKLFTYDSTRTRVVHLGVGEEFHPRSAEAVAPVLRKYGIQRPYLLFLGVNNPNKNLVRLAEAYGRSRARHDYRLVLSGPLRPEYLAPVQQRLHELGIAARADVVGYVDNADIPSLYAGAAALLLPSLYEGFGLPILEAMASGVPVLTSRTTSCPEVAAGHALLIDPEQTDDIAAGIDQVLNTPPAALAAAREYARSKSWRRTAQETLEVYRELI